MELNEAYKPSPSSNGCLWSEKLEFTYARGLVLPRVRFEGVSKAAAPWQTRGPNFDRLPRYETMLAYHGFMTPACVLSYRLYGTPVLLLCHARAMHRLELSKTGRKQPACRKRVSLSCRSCLRNKSFKALCWQGYGRRGVHYQPLAGGCLVCCCVHCVGIEVQPVLVPYCCCEDC